jgi:hypothetical protein
MIASPREFKAEAGRSVKITEVKNEPVGFPD